MVAGAKDAPSLRFKHYTVENGLSVNAVCCITQDSQGFMWFGTINGLNRFDGRNFKLFDQKGKKHSSLMGNIIFSIVEDRDNCLWVGTDLGLMLFDLRTEQYRPFDTKTRDGVYIQSRVHSIIRDRLDNIWIATLGQGVFVYDTKAKVLVQYRHNRRNPNSICSDEVRRLYEDRRGKVWVASFNYGLDEYDRKTGRFKHYLPFGKAVEMRDDNLFEDSQGNFWLANFNNGLVKMDRDRGTFTYYLKPGSPDHILHIRSIVEYAPGVLLLASDDGLTFFYTKTGRSETVKMNSTNPDGLNDNYLQTLYVDRERGLWVGSYFGGINYSTLSLGNFNHYYKTYSKNSFPGRVVSVMSEDPKGNLWIGTDDAGLVYFDVKKETFKQYLPQKGKNSLSYQNIHALLCDNSSLWIGTFSGGLDVLDLKTGRFKNYRSSDSEKSLYYSSVYAIYKDAKGNVWVGTPLGLNRYNPKEDNFDRIKELYLVGISYITQDKYGYLWVATGGKGLFRLDQKTGRWKNYRYSESNTSSLPSDKITNLCVDGKNRLWIGTDGGGLSRYSYKTDRFEKIDLDLPSNSVHSIVSDNGYLWVSTNKGLVKFQPDRHTLKIFNQSDGLQSDQFSPNAGLKTRSGQLYFGGINGFNSFDPRKMVQNTQAPNVVLSDFYLFNKRVSPTDEDSPLKQAVGYEQELVLKHSQSIVGFEFVSLSYMAPNKNQYAYMLEGFEKDWTVVTGEPKITYTNLPSGRYTLRVKASNNDGLWSRKEVALNIRVRPPFWRSNVALIIYLILIIYGVILTNRYMRRRVEDEHQEKIMRLKTEQEKELYDSKIEFFTNIVHEIRTPLTLIMGPLEYVLKSNKRVEEVKEDLLVVKRNSSRLLNLVNQLMDFRKLEAGGMYLKFVQTDVVELVRSISNQYIPAARHKNIQVNLSCPERRCLVSIDSEAFTKAIGNILSNALKFTRDRIDVEIIPREGLMVLDVRVTDNGMGIAPDEQDEIFKPFYQVKKDTPSDRMGTGVGLALTKSLVELLNGELLLESQEGVGTIFTIRLPLLADSIATVEQEFIPQNDRMEASSGRSSEDQQEVIEPSQSGGLPVVLVVDDNEELRLFLSQQLGAAYTIFCATNGSEALHLLENNRVDLVVSDVMMPEMDGFELCQRMKENVSISHIPIVLLTAKATMDDRIAGLEFGADAYIEKPFSVEHLQAQINSLLSNREKLRQKFASMPFVPSTTIANSKADGQFLERLNSIIEKNMADVEFSIEALAHELCLSRTSFFAKLKGISGLTPNDFIRLVRLKKAAELFSQGEYRINEVCFLVGFSSPSYFAKCFQKQFGVLPTEFIKGLR